MAITATQWSAITPGRHSAKTTIATMHPGRRARVPATNWYLLVLLFRSLVPVR